VSNGITSARKLVLRGLALSSALLLAGYLLVSSGAIGRAAASPAVGDFVPGQLVVKLASTSVTVEEINATYDSTTLDVFPGNAGVYLLQLPVGSDLKEVVEQMTMDPRLLYAEPNYLAESPENHKGDARMRARGITATSVSSNPYDAQNLNLSCDISQGSGTTVAVLDTGAQLDHPALKANFEDVKRYDFVDNDTNPSDKRVGLDEDGNGLTDELVGHGTHVAGIVDRVAPAAKIMPLRVLNSEGSGDVFGISKAIHYAWSNGANVINLSLGSSSHSQLLEETIDRAIEKDVVVAAAGGNSNTTVPHYPAAGDGITSATEDGLVAVTSVDRYKDKSWFANYGLWVDIAAPGGDIRSAFPVDKYADWSGTSMATPFVSGQAALIRKVYGSLDPVGIERRIRRTAESLLLQDPLYGPMMGAGHANVCKSLT
jgi:subtilisin family serine protease